MKVTGPSGVSQPVGPRQARGAQGAGFSLPAAATGSAGQAASISGPAGVMAVEALLALQETGGPLERRRRAVSRAGRILDVLEELKLALLDQGIGAKDLERLRRAVREERGSTDDARLEALLNEIETRAAVELAKLEVAGSGASS